MPNKIILTAETEFEDTALREWVSKIQTQVLTINERTKQHTHDIQELRRKLKGGNLNGNKNNNTAKTTT